MSIHKLNDKIRERLGRYADETLDTIKHFETKQIRLETNVMCERICGYLKKLNTKYKFIVNCTLFDKLSHGISLNGGCIWNVRKDQFLRIKRTSDNLIMLINVWVLSVE